MGYVRAKDNPIIINESLMGKILKSSPRYHFIPSTNKATVYDLKNKKKYTGKDAYDFIKDIDKGNYIDNNTSVHGTPKENKELKDTFKDAKTVKFKEVKQPKVKKSKETALVPVVKK